MMDISKADDIYIGSVPVQSAWLGGRKVWDRTERQIMRSMVCWYDIARQGCTNEGMAQNPVLKDLSGNGHDMSCHNFAWAGMSGIGGYPETFSNYYLQNETVYTVEKTDTSARITWYKAAGVRFLTKFGATVSVPEHRIRISGLDGRTVSVKAIGSGTDYYPETTFLEMREDGEYTVPAFDETRNNYIYFGYYVYNGDNVAGDCDITIEILPDYPGALVSDGVDDWCFVEGLPTLTDYTVIARRLYSGFEQTGNVNASLASKREASASEDGAFQFERFSGENIKTFNFGSPLDISELINSSSSVSWQTAGFYNGNALAKGGAADTQSLSLFCLRKGSAANALKAALYSLILFDRTLTDAEIEWVKANLVAPPGEDHLRLKDGILLKDGSPLLLKDGAPLALKRIENTD